MRRSQGILEGLKIYLLHIFSSKVQYIVKMYSLYLESSMSFQSSLAMVFLTETASSVMFIMRTSLKHLHVYVIGSVQIKIALESQFKPWDKWAWTLGTFWHTHTPLVNMLLSCKWLWWNVPLRHFTLLSAEVNCQGSHTAPTGFQEREWKRLSEIW